MKRELTVAHRLHELRAHNRPCRVLGQFQVVDTGHNGWQILVRVVGGHVGRGRGARLRRGRQICCSCGGGARVDGLAHNGEMRGERAQTADGQAWTARHELQEHALLVAIKRAHDVKKVLDGLALVREAMVAASALDQHLAVPGRVATSAEESLKLEK
jgi:hypothetical protein